MMDFYNQNAFRMYPLVDAARGVTAGGTPLTALQKLLVGFSLVSVESVSNVCLYSLTKAAGLTIKLVMTLPTGTKYVSIPVPVGFSGVIRFADAPVSGEVAIWDTTEAMTALPDGESVLSAPAPVVQTLVYDVSEVFVRSVKLSNSIAGVISDVATITKPINFIPGYSTAVSAVTDTNSVVVVARPGAGAGVPGGAEDGCTCEESTDCRSAMYSLGGAVPDKYGSIKLTPGTGISITSPAAHTIDISCTAAANTGCL